MEINATSKTILITSLENGSEKPPDFFGFQEQTIDNGTEEAYLFSWFISASNIAPGTSAILGGNYFAFYAIHYVALCTISISLLASIIVIFKIHSKWKHHNSKLDFPIRFPLYLAIADLFWGISHFSDHLYLVILQKYPENSTVKIAFCVNLWLCFGYQQLMHASIAVYTYLSVVHRKKLNFGRWEWKLHVTWLCFLVMTAITLAYLDGFGNAGYWMGHETTTVIGKIAAGVAALTSTLNAICTTFCYRTIHRTIQTTERNLRNFHSVSIIISNPQSRRKRSEMKKESVASQCLTTYVYIASFLYCPLAFFLWTNLLFSVFMNVIEPLSCLLSVIVANSSGWANAYGYFHNEKLKARKHATRSIIKSTSSAVNSTDRFVDNSKYM